MISQVVMDMSNLVMLRRLQIMLRYLDKVREHRAVLEGLGRHMRVV